MTSELLNRVSINDVDDFVNGAGMKAHIQSVSVGSMSVGKTLSKICGNTGTMSALVSIVIAYDAGYSIGGTYQYQSKGNVSDIDTIEGRKAFAKDGQFDFGIAYAKDDYMPYNNWWVQVDDNEEVLADIAQVGTDEYADDTNDSIGTLGEAFGFEYDESCRAVAYMLEGCLDVRNGTRNTCPISASEFDAMARQAMIDYLVDTQD